MRHIYGATSQVPFLYPIIFPLTLLTFSVYVSTEGRKNYNTDLKLLFFCGHKFALFTYSFLFTYYTLLLEGFMPKNLLYVDRF